MIFYATQIDEFGPLEKDIKIWVKETTVPPFVMDEESQIRF